MGITEKHRVLVLNDTTNASLALDLPSKPSVETDGATPFDHVVIFVKQQEELDDTFPLQKQHLSSEGKLWVAWPKGGRLGTDLTIREVIRIGYDHGMVESTNLRIDDTWTALKFTHPKPNKTYHNSYGTLKR